MIKPIYFLPSVAAIITVIADVSPDALGRRTASLPLDNRPGHGIVEESPQEEAPQLAKWCRVGEPEEECQVLGSGVGA